MVVTANKVDCQCYQLVEAVRHVDAHQSGIAQESGKVLAQEDDIELLALLVPIATYALENPCPVVKGVGHDRDLRLLQRDDLALEKGEFLWRAIADQRILLTGPNAQSRTRWAVPLYGRRNEVKRQKWWARQDSNL